MHRIFRTAPVLLCALTTASILYAHEEPPKTLAERMEYERHRKLIAAGHVQTETVWTMNESGERKKQLVTRYDRNGNAIEQIAFGPDSAPTVRVLSHYTLEHLVFEQIVIAGHDTEKTAFTYLAPRIIAAATEYAPSGYVRGRLVYTYTDTVITAAKTDSLDAPVYTMYYRYPPGTEHRQMTEAVQVDAGGRQTTRIRNVFNGEHRTEKRVYGSADTLEFTFLYAYTAQGEFDTITRRLAGGTIAYERRYRYAADGLLERITEFDGAGAVRSTLVYEYDRYDSGR
jgi:hypothetical protein